MARVTKMNQDMRVLARNALLRHALLDRLTASFKRERAIFDRVYALAIPAKELKALKALDPKWLTIGHKMTINALGWQLEVRRFTIDGESQPSVYFGHYQDGRETIVKEPKIESVIMPRLAHWGCWNVTTSLQLPDDLSQEAQAWSQEKSSLKETVQKIGQQIRSTIAGFATLDALIEAIPEIATLEPRILEPKKREQALVPNVQGLMCKIASVRGEAREGCSELAAAA